MSSKRNKRHNADTIRNKTESKAVTEYISCDCKCKFNSNSKRKWKSKTCQCECKSYSKYKKDYSWNPSTGICEKVFKSVADTSVTESDEIILF